MAMVLGGGVAISFTIDLKTSKRARACACLPKVTNRRAPPGHPGRARGNGPDHPQAPLHRLGNPPWVRGAGTKAALRPARRTKRRKSRYASTLHAGAMTCSSHSSFSPNSSGDCCADMRSSRSVNARCFRRRSTSSLCMWSLNRVYICSAARVCSLLLPRVDRSTCHCSLSSKSWNTRCAIDPCRSRPCTRPATASGPSLAELLVNLSSRKRASSASVTYFAPPPR